MVKYALVRHPNNGIALGINHDVESQEEILHIEESQEEILHIEERYIEEKTIFGIVCTLSVIAVIVGYSS